jgi:hypothetical protein
MTIDLHTARPRTIRSDAAIASLPADAKMTYDEYVVWCDHNLGVVERLVAAMTPAEQAAFCDRIRTDELAAVA